MIDYTYYDQYLYPTTCIVGVTEECNLACRYCFVNKHPNYMTLDIAKDIAKYLVNNFKYQHTHINEEIKDEVLNERIEICFFGGEPLIMYDSIIKPLILWYEETYPDVTCRFTMTTNGTLLTEERLQFLSEHDAGILFSIDGNEAMQNYNRPYKNQTNETSSETLEQIIPILLKYYPDVCARVTAYGPSINELYNSYLYLEDKGFQSITIVPDIRHDWTDEQLDELELQLNDIFRYRLEQLLSGQKVCYSGVLNYWEEETARFINPEMSQIKLKPQRCGIGICCCAVGYDGTIYGCQEQISGYETYEDNLFKIGDIYNGIDKEKHKRLIDFYMHQEIPESETEDCNKCVCNGFCTPRISCFSSLYSRNHTSYKYPKELCRYQQIMVKNSFVSLLTKAELSKKDTEIKEE